MATLPQAATDAMARYCANDVALSDFGREFADPERVEPRFDLRWIDPAYHEAGDQPVGAYERVRRFKHIGAAIAWSRRQIFHGRVFGDHIEMTTISRLLIGGEIRESESHVTDITLGGFSVWQGRGGEYGLRLDRLMRKCKAPQDV